MDIEQLDTIIDKLINKGEIPWNTKIKVKSTKLDKTIDVNQIFYDEKTKEVMIIIE